MWITLLRILGILTLVLVATALAGRLLQLVSRVLADRRLNRLKTEQLRLEIESLRASLQTMATSGQAWDGWRKFRVHRKVEECEGVHSVYLVPHDGKPLPTYQPGQYVTFQLRPAGEAKPVVRCYSLSAAPNPEYFRCTVKKVQAPANAVGVPPGKGSTFFNDEVQEGDLVDLKSPRGSFHLDEADTRPVALISAGIGVTPIFAMLQSLTKGKVTSDVHVFFGVRSSQEHVFKQEIEEIDRAHRNVTVTVCYSDPLDSDVKGEDYDVSGRISMDLIRERLPSNNFAFYICGPGGFMEMATTGLRNWGVPASSIHTEAFGPSAVKKSRDNQPTRVVGIPEPSASGETNGRAKVVFDRSNKECAWEDNVASLLELAESVGVAIDAGCRSGNCGTCATAIKAGSVDYAETPESNCDEGSCLPCVAIPKGPVVLDA